MNSFANNNTKEFLKLVLKRPGMFVEKIRLDMIVTLYHGWCIGRGEQDWDADFDISNWLWKQEGILRHCDPLKFFPFYITYGVKEFAIEKMRQMVEEIPFTPVKQTLDEAYLYRKEKVEPVSSLEELLDPIWKESSDNFLAYLFTDGYFTQIRIFKKEGETYREVTKEISEKERIKIHDQLDKLNIENELSFCIFTLEKTQGQILIKKEYIPHINNLATINISHQNFEEDYVLANIFKRWKEKMIG